jgi:hypothetical protein
MRGAMNLKLIFLEPEVLALTVFQFLGKTALLHLQLLGKVIIMLKSLKSMSISMSGRSKNGIRISKTLI